jgi:hypothetical protein
MIQRGLKPRWRLGACKMETPCPRARKAAFASANKTLDTIKCRAARHGGSFGL